MHHFTPVHYLSEDPTFPLMTSEQLSPVFLTSVQLCLVFIIFDQFLAMPLKHVCEAIPTLDCTEID